MGIMGKVSKIKELTVNNLNSLHYLTSREKAKCELIGS